MVGTAQGRLCPPYRFELERAICDKFNTTAAPGVALAKPGQITTSDFQNRVKPQNQKYFASQFWKSEL